MLSGNRNFEGRINPDIKMNYLASPPLVVAYALAGSMDVDLDTEPLGQDQDGNAVFLQDIWPSPQEIEDVDRVGDRLRHVHRRATPTSSPATSAGRTCRRPTVTCSSGTPTRPTSASPRTSTAWRWSRRRSTDITGARVLLKLGDSVTTDHISPAGAIKEDSPAGTYLSEHGVEPRDFNSYGSRRGNHEVMIRGTFANIRLRNQLAPGTEGGFTRDLIDGGDGQTVDLRGVRGLPGGRHAARGPRGQGVRLGLVA